MADGSVGGAQPSPTSLQALLDEARQCRVQGQDNGNCMDLQGQRCVIKWAEVKPWMRLRSWVAALACWFALGERVAPAALRAGNIQTEVERLLQLADAGRRVPPIWLQADDGLILGWVGESLDTVIPRLNPDEKIALFTRVLEDLADWHARGLWHGGAQLRNVTVCQDELYRIDFEERHGVALSRPATCAYDVLLCLGDALSLLEAEQVMAQGRVLLGAYWERLSEADRPAIRQKLLRLARVLHPLVWVDQVWPRATRRRDKQRVIRFARVVRAVLEDAPPLRLEPRVA